MVPKVLSKRDDILINGSNDKEANSSECGDEMNEVLNILKNNLKINEKSSSSEKSDSEESNGGGKMKSDSPQKKGFEKSKF